MKRVLVTGATGFIGGHLVRALGRRGDEVTIVTRDATGARRVFGTEVRAATWEDIGSAVEGQNAIVALAGEQAVGVRWTDSAKERIRRSRVDTVGNLVRAMGEAKSRPSVLVAGSAVGYYGAREGDEELTEKAPPGSDFLAQVCVAWEAAANQARALGVRVVNARIGIVLAGDGGALSEMTKPFRLFAGGPIGSGEQVVSWVHVDDLIAILLRAIDDEALDGPLNAVAPGAVTNDELSREIGRVLGRPSWLRVPAAALRARFGEGAEPLLTGQRAIPSRLAERGHVFIHPTLSGALEEALGRR
jgi:uncharacterized protein (TIGR01777 family)